MKLKQLPKIYPITSVQLSGLSHAAQVKNFIDGGATLIQLREKKAAPRDFFDEAVRALDIAREQPNVKIIINDRVDLALAAKADGVHLGQTDLPPTAARKVLGKNAIIGLSTHNLEQALAAQKMPIDYIAMGPIFATNTKENPDTLIGLDYLKQIRAALGDFPLVAIGGITLKNATSVIKAGADSLAVISGLFTDKKNINKTVKKFLTL